MGANDIVNPATQDDPSSPIYGMPAIEIWKCKQCVVLKLACNLWELEGFDVLNEHVVLDFLIVSVFWFYGNIYFGLTKRHGK